ncbi:MAG: hypothetical protein J07HQX50_02753 [Haloquadratum sp. J07HQX50]|nr:MAG: hypothetical protein J07HQX50_02753 [Haloquadratum sp. J07HQX50]
MAFGLSARVIDGRPDGVELDRTTHHLSRLVAEAAEEVEDHAAVVFFRVFDARALLVVAVIEVALVDVFPHEVRVRLPGMTGGAVVLGDDALHPVTEPAREWKGGDDAADLVLRVVVLVVAVRGVVSVGHNAVPDHQQVGLDSHENVAVDVFNHSLVSLVGCRPIPWRSVATRSARSGSRTPAYAFSPRDLPTTEDVPDRRRWWVWVSRRTRLETGTMS